MSVDRKVDWCLLWIGPCMPSSEWASWMQAIMSVAAVLSAVGVVWWQFRIKALQDLAAAKLAGSGILVFLDQAIGGLEAVSEGLIEQSLGEMKPSNDLHHLLRTLESLPLPSRDDLVALNLAMPECSTTALRASNSVQQLCTTLRLLVGMNQDYPMSAMEVFRPLVKLSKSAVQGLVAVREELDQFCPK